jgi:nitroreductase
MRKEAVVDLIQKRWSPYSFSSSVIDEVKLKSLFEAAARAPSSNNEQPWLFVYTTQKNALVFNDYLGFLNETNRIWAKNAFALVISFARMRFLFNGKPNRYAFHDTGMAVMNLLTQAASMDIFVHQMGGFSVDSVKMYFNLPEDIEPVAIMAVGYIGDKTSLPPDLQNRDEKRRLRKRVEEFCFKDQFSE